MLLRGTGLGLTGIDAVYDMLRSIDRFQLEKLAGESMCANMAHPAGVLDIHSSRNPCQPDTVWELIGRDERHKSAIASRDEVTEARRLGGYRG